MEEDPDMKLVIHDLSAKDWARIETDYAPCTVVADSGTIRPCVGCFGCWNRDPGRCIQKDGYENMGYLVHHADEVVVISRCTYGGLSGFVKNVIDRCLAYVLPQFELVSSETHHKKRYDETKPFSFVFYGHDLSEVEKASAFRYVTAMCTNFRAYVKKVEFREGGALPAAGTKHEYGTSDDSNSASPGRSELSEAEAIAAETIAPAADRTEGVVRSENLSGKVLLLNGSMRSANGNSAILSAQLTQMLKTENESVALKNYLSDMSALVPSVESAEALVLCMPLYVDGLPSQVIRFMELMQRVYRGAPKKVYVLANMGLYESRQLVNLFSAVHLWCGAMGFLYGGGLGVSAGELVGGLLQILPFGAWPTQEISRGMARLAVAIDCDGRIDDIYTEPRQFPRSLYITIANTNWDRTAKQNGLKPEDLYRRV